MAHWTRSTILAELRRLDERGQRVCYAQLMSKNPRLYFAARYHFGSFRDALRRAHLPELAHSLRPRWTRDRIIRLIKLARRSDEALNWQSVIERKDQLKQAAFASLQKRLFGSWAKALNAAGVDADDVRAYLDWSPEYVLSCLKQRHADGESLRASDVRDEDASLHAASVRHFKSFAAAVGRTKPKRRKR